ncbi:MAG: hypothetical protein IJ160_06125 [Muribaculaceae bacterium]|nr:hypothetical protein [Muribaculaceae bacterium]
MIMFKDLTYNTELVEAYLAGTMSADERKHFEAQMAKDEKLRQEVQLHRLTVAALQHHGRREDQSLTEAMQGMTRDELKALLQRRRQQLVDAAACVAPEEGGDKRPFGIGAFGEDGIAPLVASAPPYPPVPIRKNLWLHLPGLLSRPESGACGRRCWRLRQW